MRRTGGSPAGVFLALTLALAAGAGLRLQLMRGCSPFGSDSFHYLELARGLVEDGRFESRGSQHPDLSRYPLYPVLIAAAAGAGLSYENAGRAVTFLVSLGLALPLWFLARAAFGRRAALPAAILGAVSCAAAGTSSMFPDALAALLYVSTAAAMLATLRRWTVGPALATGALAALAALTRPEGVLWGLAALAVAALGAVWRGGPAGRGWIPLAAIAGVFVPVHLAYLGWVSSGLDRICLSPGVEYVRSVRETGDRYGVRRFDTPGTSWEDRASFLLDAGRGEFVLSSRFATGEFPPADPRWGENGDASAPAHASSGPESGWPAVKRRIFIATRSAGLLPGALRSGHLLPPVPVALAALGIVTSFRSRMSRKGLAFLLATGILTLSPLVSHIENRFLLPGFVVAMAAAGRGWAVLDFRLRRLPVRFEWSRPAIHGLLLLGTVASTWAHGGVCGRSVDQEDLYRRAGAAVADRTGGGPVLAVLPHVPWFADRPYRRLPLGGAEEARDYARATGARTVVVTVPYDANRRPDLGSLLALPPPEGFRLLERLEGNGGAEVRILAVDSGDRP